MKRIEIVEVPNAAKDIDINGIKIVSNRFVYKTLPMGGDK